MQDDRLRTSLGYALVRAFRTVNRASGRAMQPFGLSGEQVHILFVLWSEGPKKVGALQRLLALSSATLTGALDRMVRDGLVRRRRDDADLRAWVVEPAPVAAGRRKKIEARLEQLEEEAFAMLSPSERKTLLELLERVAQEPEQRASDAGIERAPRGAARSR
jgi:DNA-binding MarR family transcriptional regulator